MLTSAHSRQYQIALRLWVLLHCWTPPFEWWMIDDKEPSWPSYLYQYLKKQGWIWNETLQVWIHEETGKIENLAHLPTDAD